MLSDRQVVIGSTTCFLLEVAVRLTPLCPEVVVGEESQIPFGLPDGVAHAQPIGSRVEPELTSSLDPEGVPDSNTHEPLPSSQQTTALFRREADFWTVALGGHVARVKHSRGLEYLARLLAQPGMTFHVLNLVCETDPERSSGSGRKTTWVEEVGPVSGHTGPEGRQAVLDDAAIAAYRQRARELRAELDEASNWCDTERAAQIQRELDFLEEELLRNLGLGGGSRLMPSTGERARVSVTKAIRRAIKSIAQKHPTLAAHLVNSVKTGATCVYAPDPHSTITWSF
ncbi:MAG: hypothetical protein JO057_13540 [Chloroflexi bacterium]|nr:hypothetical protein [Chloroflexota bacterium]